MLEFLSLSRARAPEGPLGNAETRAWLGSIAEADAQAAAGALIDRLVELNRAELQVRLRLRLLDMFSDHADKLLPELEERFMKARPPLSGNARQAAHLTEKLYKELATGYSMPMLRAPRLWLSAGFKDQVHIPLLRAMDYHARRLALSERLYAPNPRGVWLALHRLYRVAKDWKIHDREDPGRRSAASIYKEALLLAFAQPQQLGPGDLKRVQQYLRNAGRLAILDNIRVDTDAPGLFLVDARGDTPGFSCARRARSAMHGGTLVLDARQLIEALQAELRQLRQANKIAAAQPQAYRIDLLQRLDDNWRGRHLPRAVRTRFHPRAEVWTGLDQIWRLLLDIKRGARAPIHNASRWVILNESARGFALKFMSGSIPSMAVGEIIALRADDGNKPHLCVVRWVASSGPEHLEVGVEQLAPLAIPAAYKKPGKAPKTPNAVLYLPTTPGPQQSALLIAAPALINTARAVELRHANGRLALHATRIAETTSSVQLIEVVPA